MEEHNEDEKTTRGRKIDTRIFVVIAVLSSFIVGVLPLNTVKLSVMGTSDFFFESIVPNTYWLGIIVLLAASLYSIRLLYSRFNVGLLVFVSIMLMVLIRSVFPIVFDNVTFYEPDALNYINVVSGWLRTSLDFGVSGNYQHDYPLSFFVAFLFGKVGVAPELFYRFSPIFIYVIELIIVYFIIAKVTSNPKVGAIGVFLFSFSPLNYWLSVHFCPDLLGSLFFLVSLYLVLRLTHGSSKRPLTWILLVISVFLLILAHHLGTLYFVITMAGLALTSWYFKSPLKGKYLYFLLSGVYAYTLWFTYGNFMYPDFFNIYSYLGLPGNAVTLASQSNFFEIFSFMVYPVFIFSLVIFYVHKNTGLEKLIDYGKTVIRTPLKLLNRKMFPFEISSAMQFSSGYLLVVGLFIVGLIIPVIFAPRVLEVLLIGIYPVAASALLSLTSRPMSRKKLVLLYIILSVVVLLGIHRYYSQIQGRVIGR